MSALWQRIAVHSKVVPLDLEHTGRYIRHRLTVAAASDAELFTSDAIVAVYEKAKGIPRLVNTLCDRALLVAFARDAVTVNRDMVEAAARDLELKEQDSEEKPEPERHLRPVEQDLVVKVLERLDAVEKQQEQILEALEKLQSQSSPADSSSPQRRWLHRLRGGE
jgi:general secretion pathway protein A